MEKPKRKHARLKEYDYGADGCYFVTVCVKARKSILSTIPVGRDTQPTSPPVGRDAHIPPSPVLTQLGAIADKYINNINTVYTGITVESYVIMPNHIHLLIKFAREIEPGGVRGPRPTLHTVVRSFKTMVTREASAPIWQASYYDRVIRGEADLIAAMRYIEENPLKWLDDELYTENNQPAGSLPRADRFLPYISFFQSPCRLQYAYAATALSPATSAKSASGAESTFNSLRWLPCSVSMDTHSILCASPMG